jgi:hypothetical protein
VEGGGWRVEGGGWRVEGGGWRMEGGGWRVEGAGSRWNHLQLLRNQAVCSSGESTQEVSGRRLGAHAAAGTLSIHLKKRQQVQIIQSSSN